VKRIPTAPLLVILSVLVLVPVTFGQQEQTEGARKIVSRVTPHYPEIARTMHLSGSVKAEAVVQPNGVVKSVNVTGGHPVLVGRRRKRFTSGSGRLRLTRPRNQSKSSSIASNTTQVEAT
jgi:hypothetical protein